MPESGTRETRGGTTTEATATTIAGMTAKTAGTGAGERKGMKLIVPLTNSIERGREHTGSIATSIRTVTIAAKSSGSYAVNSSQRVLFAAAVNRAGM